MKKFLLILITLIVVVAGVLGYLVYQALDEENYRKQILDSTQQLLGRQMEINGQVKVTLFPSPVITLTNVSVLNPPGFEYKHFAEIEQIEAHVEFSSLFNNPLVVQNVVLKNPQFFIEKNEKNAINWNFSFLKSDASMIGRDDFSTLNQNSLPPQFQNIQIEDGTLTYLNKPLNIRMISDKINGELQAKSIRGPFDFKGTVNWNAVPVEATLHADMLTSEKQTKFNLNLSAVNHKSSLSVQEGTILRFAEPTQQIDGSFNVNIENLTVLLSEMKEAKDLPVNLNKSVQGAGHFSLSANNVTFDDFAFVYGGYGDVNKDIAVAGKVVLVYPVSTSDKMKTDIMLNFSQLNLDLLPVYANKYSSVSDLLNTIKATVPDGMDFLITATQATLWEKPLTNLSVKGRYYDGIIDLLDVSAILPESATLTTKGNIITDENKQSATLYVNVKSEDFGSTFAWTKIKTPFVQDASALKKTDLSFQFDWTPEALNLKQINAQVGNGKITGDLKVSAKNSDTVLKLQLDSLNFDHFVAFTPYTEEKSFAQALSDFQNYLATSSLFPDRTVQFDVTGTNITFKTLPIQRFVFVGSANAKELVTDKLELTQIATANIRYNGKITKDQNNILALENALINVDIPKAQLFFDRFKVRSPLSATAGKITANATLNGTLNALTISLQNVVSQGKIQLNGNLSNILSGEPDFDLQTKISFPSLLQFVRLFDPVYKGNPNLNGAFSFDGHVISNETGIKLENAALSVGPQKVVLDLELSKQDEIRKVTGKINSPQLYMDKFVVSSNEQKNRYSKNSFDFSSMDNLQLDILLSAAKASWENFDMDNFETHVLLNDKILKIDQTKAQIGKGKMTFDAALNYSAATPYLKGRLVLDAVPVRPDVFKMGIFYLKNGDLSFVSDFNAKGNSIDDMVKSLSATGNFTVTQGTISGLNLTAFERRSQAMIIRTDLTENGTTTLNRTLTTGETPFSSLHGTYAITKGIARSTDTVLKTPTANALVQLDLNIPAWTVSASGAISFKNLSGYPPVSVSVKGIAQNAQTQLDIASFVKYINDSAANTKNEQIRQQREVFAQKQQAAAKERLEKIAQLTLEAQSQIEAAEKTLNFVSSDAAQMHIVRAKDAFVLLQELSKKDSPSDADVAKASTQATQIKSRVQSAMSVINNEAGNAFRQELTKNITSAREQMQLIERVYQRLGNAEIIKNAYQTGVTHLNQMQQLNTFAGSSDDLMKLQQAVDQSNQALYTIKMAYQSIQKYDVDALQNDYDDQGSTRSMQGSIRRE